MTTNELEQILRRIGEKNLPPVHLWNPQYSGDMDMRIAVDGSWYYRGSKISRQRMVNLFSTILRFEQDQYFLVTPVEKFRIKVDDAVFIATRVDKINTQPQVLVFTTNVDEEIIADADHRVIVHTDPSNAQPRPYLQVRDGLTALITRSVFYELVEWASPRVLEGATHLAIESQGQVFSLGRL